MKFELYMGVIKKIAKDKSSAITYIFFKPEG